MAPGSFPASKPPGVAQGVGRPPPNMVHIEMPTGGDDAKGVGISHSDASLSQDKSKEDTVKRPLSVTMGTWSLPRKGEDMWDTRECKVGGEKLFIALVADGHGAARARRAARLRQALHARLRRARSLRACSLRGGRFRGHSPL